jgi:hypothetical protein
MNIVNAAKKKLILSSINQLILIVKNNERAQSLPKFSKIKTMELSSSPTKTCNCARPWKVEDQNKQVIENTLSSFTPGEFAELKNALELDELCYYLRDMNTKKLELICV